ADLAGEGHVAGLDDPRHRAAAGRPAGRGADVRLLRAVRGGRGLLLGDLLRAVLRPDPAGDEAGEVRGEVTDLLTVRDVEKSFGELQVLRGISFDVPAGSVTAVIGPSGSGKTTMLRTLNALDRADTGVITIGDLTVDFSGEVDRATLTRLRLQSGMVFPNLNLFPHMTVLQDVMQGPVVLQKRPREEALADARRLLDQVGLAEKAVEYPFQLSGGQQQRVGIARALALQPKLMLF